MLLAGNKLAIVFDVVGNVPVYRQGDARFRPVPVIMHQGIPTPKSLVPRSVLANIAIAAAASSPPKQQPPQQQQHQQRQDGAVKPMGSGPLAAAPALEANAGPLAGVPPPPAPFAAGGPDDDFVENDIVFGPPIEKQMIDWKREAKSTKHLLRHKPFNRFCDTCCDSKMHNTRHYKGSFQRCPKKWGELVTADHLVTNKRGKKHGIHKWKNAFNIKDVFLDLDRLCSCSG